MASCEGEKTSKNPEFVHLVAVKNVRLTIDRVRQRSPILRELGEQGAIEIVGAMYEMKTGQIEYLD